MSRVDKAVAFLYSFGAGLPADVTLGEMCGDVYVARDIEGNRMGDSEADIAYRDGYAAGAMHSGAIKVPGMVERPEPGEWDWELNDGRAMGWNECVAEVLRLNAGTDRTRMYVRESFETWFSDGGQSPKAVQRSGDGYLLMQAQSAWTAWQAAWQFAAPSPEDDAAVAELVAAATPAAGIVMGSLTADEMARLRNAIAYFGEGA